MATNKLTKPALPLRRRRAPIHFLPRCFSRCPVHPPAPTGSRQMTTTTGPEAAESIVDDGGERVETSEERHWFQRVLDHPRAVVGTCATIAGVWAMIGSRFVFPLLSNNHDEAVYLL